MNTSHQKCCDRVRRYLKPGAAILEVSCGKGFILGQLQAEGYRTTGTNYSRYAEQPEGVDIRVGVDILSGLPFPDAAFDGVILCDVIEHLPDHVRTLGELVRVLKPGGYSFILSPNTNKISSRLHFLFTGFLKVKRAFVGFDVPADKAFAFHNHPPMLPVFLYQCHSAGLDWVELDATAPKFKSLLFWLLLAPWIKLITWANVKKERNLSGRPEGALMNRALTSFKALCGESWVLVHRRRAGTTAAEGVRATVLPAWHVRASAAG